MSNDPCEGFLGLFDSHTWGKWVQVEGTMSFFLSKEEHPVVMQIRTCQDCGLQERKNL